jgi:acetyl esterase/lipase
MKPLLLLLSLAASAFADLTPSERELIQQLGPDTPEPILLWPDKPPQFMENAVPEVIAENQRIRSVSVPTITPYLPPKDKRTGMAVVICAGGGYGGHDWKTHVVYAAQVFNPMGVVVIGLKYRTRPPHILPNEGIQALTLLDAKRAMRLVRHRAAEWGHRSGENRCRGLFRRREPRDESRRELRSRRTAGRRSHRPPQQPS